MADLQQGDQTGAADGVIEKDGTAYLVFELKWSSGLAEHVERIQGVVNLWHDFLPAEVVEALVGAAKGDVVKPDLLPDTICQAHDPRHVREVPARRFARGLLQPRLGRFYPKPLLEAVPALYAVGGRMFRVIGMSDKSINVDLNHPLAGREPKLAIRVVEPRADIREISAECVEWLRLLSDGPGMQVRYKQEPTDFFSGDSLERDDEDPDAEFYAKPKAEYHLDENARAEVSALYGELVPRGAKVLDLMSGWHSHLPADLELSAVTGLGLNRQELDNNPALSDRVIKDINQNPDLDFEDGAFDAVICTSSVEYLIKPAEVFAEIRRVLKPGGAAVFAFSNRSFPPKVTKVWDDLHEFERMGLVSELLLEDGGFKGLHTLSNQGRLIPEKVRPGRGAGETDPFYAVWAYRK